MLREPDRSSPICTARRWYFGVPARRPSERTIASVDHHHPPSDAVIGTVRSRLAAQAAVIRVWLFSLALAAAAAIVYLDVRSGAVHAGRAR